MLLLPKRKPHLRPPKSVAATDMPSVNFNYFDFSNSMGWEGGRSALRNSGLVFAVFPKARTKVTPARESVQAYLETDD